MSDFQTFIKAVEYGKLEEVMNSFQPDFLEKTTDFKMQPIHVACKKRHLGIVQFLFQNKCNIECENKDKMRPIHLACDKTHLEIVKFLVQNKCSIECEDKYKMRPIHFACKNGNLEIVKFLVQNKCSIECENENKMRPIHFACKNGNLEVVDFLFKNKCSLECENEDKMRPIHFSCESEALRIVKFLFQNKCSLECENKDKMRPIHFGCEIGNFFIVRYLLQNKCSLECEDKDKMRPIHFACQNGNFDTVKFLFQRKCSLECEDDKMRRPIHLACENGHLEIVQFLFEKGCSLECEDNRKFRPIHFACENRHLKIVRFLFQNNCNIECEDNDKRRPIHLACWSGHLKIVNFLFQNNCSLECEAERNWRPIHYACWIGHLEIAKFLFQNKCSLESEVERNWRPIHFACLKGHLNIVKFLIQSNCELDCRTKDDESPMEIAMKNGHELCADLVNENLKKRKIFDCIRRNDARAFSTMYSPDILMMDEHENGVSLLEVVVKSNAIDIIDYILNKLVTAEELSTLENYLKNCRRSDTVQLIQECLLYRSIRFHDSNGFHLYCLAKTINEPLKLIKSSFLEVAAEYDCKPFIHLILKKSIYNDEEWTRAKNLAIAKGHAEIAEALSDRKNLLKKRADKHFTWLHSAVCDNDPDMVEYILEKDLANPNSNNEVVGTALALAHMMCYEKCIKMLEKFNVDVNTQNKYSQSPLHEAIASGTVDHCSYLISLAEDIDRPGFMGFTGLQCAVIEGCEELCEELVQNGADCLQYVRILQQSTFNKPVLPISESENAVTLCAKIHQKIYPCLLQALDSDKLKCSDVQSMLNNEIFHLAMTHGDPKILLSLFEKVSPTVQQLVIDDLLDLFASTDNYNDFVKLLNIEIAVPKLFANGETLLTNLLKQKKLKYCWAIINCERNKKCLVSPNVFNETPLQIAIESELFDLMNPLILNCDDEEDFDFNWNIQLIPLFHKLSMSSNNDTDQKLLAAIKAIILRGGDIYKQVPEDVEIINYCTRFKDKIEKFQQIARAKGRHEKNICSVCMDREVNCVLDCGHTFCMECGPQLCRCAICNSGITNPKRLYFN